MKQTNSYSIDWLRVCRNGFAALMFFVGITPAMAQDETDVDEAEFAVKREVKKPQKNYPMMEVTGKVVDAATGEALAGVKLSAYNNIYYTAMTDEDGTYTIKVPTFVTSIAANLEGYNLVRTALNGRTANVNIQLYSASYTSDYVARTVASKQVDIQGFEETTALTADDEIHNRLGGDVRSITRSALNGQGSAMFINGINSLNTNAQPLIVIDGVVFDMMYDSESLHAGYFTNLLTSLNMDDVETIEVMKNGTAIYGAKAANGVILINTKRNKSMATRIDFNARFGMEFMPKTMDVMEADDYRAYASQLIKSTGAKLENVKFLNPNPDYHYYPMYHNNTDWKKQVYDEAFSQNYSIHIQGGDDVANYNLSVGYTDASSTLKKNDMNRFNIRFNTDVLLNKWFTTRFDASYSNTTRDLRDVGWLSDYSASPLASTNVLALIKAPFLSPYGFTVQRVPSSTFAGADDYLDEVLGAGVGSLANPSAILKNGEAKNKNHSDLTQINIAIAPKWQPTQNLSVTERFSYTMQSFDESYYTPIVGMPAYNFSEQEGTTYNTKNSQFTKHNAVFSDTRADWAIPLGAHRLDVFGGVRFMNDTYRVTGLMGDNTPNDKSPNNANSQKSKKIVGTDISWRSLTYYANVDYNYMEKYYLQGILAMETSSRYGKDTDAGLKMFGVPWGFFPSLQGAWVITNENWFKPNNGVNMLKLNVGFESVGNDAIDNNATLTYMQGSSLLGGGIPSITFAHVGNSKLRWETTNRVNAGIEGNFINNRLNVRFNYYKSWTNNLIATGMMAYVAGLGEYQTNDGKLQNEGFDFAFNTKVINAPKLKFELGGSIGHYKNKITRLPQGKTSFLTDVYGGTILTQVGSPAGLFYGYKTNGVYATSADAEKAGLYITDNTGAPTYFKGGDMRFVDTDGNFEINDADRVVIGDPNPDIYGNIHANFYIGKRWSVSANFNYSLGNDIYNYQRAMLESGSQFMNQTTAMKRRWMAEGQQTDIPGVTYGDPMGNARFSDRWIEDGSYLKLKNITVSYNIPIQNQYIQGLTVWAAGNDLFTLTRYLGNDPEVCAGNGVLMQGIDAGYLNYGRSITLGVKINL